MCSLIVFVICIAAVVIDAKEEITSKRLVLHSDDDFAAALQTVTAQLQQQQRVIAELTANLTETNRQLSETKQTSHAHGHGSTYIRWGRTICQGNGTELVYKGFAAGNYYNFHGGAADFVCLPDDPLWGVYDDSHQTESGRMYGVEYEFGELFSDGGTKFFGQNLYQHDAPCAMCYSSRTTTIMIPGRNQCYPGWTMEYSGYLVSGRADGTYDVAASNYACLDTRSETEFGGDKDENGKLVVLVEAFCGSLKCPPYVQNRELTCVVCSR